MLAVRLYGKDLRENALRNGAMDGANLVCRDMGRIERDEYPERRQQLEQEMESLRPIDYDNLIEAADLLRNFRIDWNQCDQVENPKEARKQLLTKIVERVFVYGDQILAIVLYGDFAVLLGGKQNSTLRG